MATRNILAAAVSALFVIVTVAPYSFAAQCACPKCAAQPVCQKAAVCKEAPKLGVANDGAWKKLGRGFCNLVTFPFELPNQISRVNNSDGPMAAFTWGLIKGVGMTCFRALVGAYEVISFPVGIPADYQPILTDPEFFFDGELCLY